MKRIVNDRRVPIGRCNANFRDALSSSDDALELRRSSSRVEWMIGCNVVLLAAREKRY